MLVFTTSLRWSSVAIVQWHHKKPATSISIFLTLTVTALLTTGIFNFPTPTTAFSLLLWSTSLFCCIITDLRILIFFLHSFFAKWIHSTSRNLFCKPCKLYQSLFYKSYDTLMPSFATLGCIGWLKTHTKFFQNLPDLFQSRFLLTQTARLLACYAKSINFFYKALTVSVQNSRVHNKPLESITFITDLFITDHVHNRPCS